MHICKIEIQKLAILLTCLPESIFSDVLSPQEKEDEIICFTISVVFTIPKVWITS